MQQHTRRCLTCGELKFMKLLGETTTQKVKKKRSIIDHFDRICNDFEETNSVLEKQKKNAVLLSVLSLCALLKLHIYIVTF